MTETTDELFARVSKGKAQCHCGAPAGDPCRGLASGQTILPHVGRPNLTGPDSETTQDLTAPTCHGDCCAGRTIPWPAALDPHRAQPGYTPRPVVTEPPASTSQVDAFTVVRFGDQPDTEDIREAFAAELARIGEWPELEPGSHTAGLTGGPFHRYAECTNDHCPIHPD